MSTQRDIAQLPDDARSFLHRQGISLNPLVWHASYRYPDEARQFEPVRTRQRFYLLKTTTINTTAHNSRPWQVASPYRAEGFHLQSFTGLARRTACPVSRQQ